ncbi:MAG: hypothetical protein HFH72_08525 [Lachnospiraceae bacterium]|nr:hypothetical protein [Lachnospiraceae bacterium]
MMRVTSQMLDKAAAKSGLPIRRASLLDYIDNPSLGNNPLLNSLEKNSGITVDSKRKEAYEKLEKAADKLFQSADVLTDDGEKSAFAEAEKSGDAGQVYDGISNLLENYNNLLEVLKSSSSPINDYYRKMMEEAAEENSEAFSSVGITISKEGTVSIDQEKLKTADLKALEKIFGTSGTFTVKTEFLAARVALNAQAGISSISNQYDSMGSSFSASYGKYDFWG